MNSATRTLATVGVAAMLLFGGVTGARAVVVTPVVELWTVTAGTLGFVPDPADLGFPLLDFGIDVQPTPALLATTAVTVSNLTLGGAETAEGRADVAIEPLNFNASVVKRGARCSPPARRRLASVSRCSTPRSAA